MSSPLAALGNRTPEQLKVTELREELKKRGIACKGLKKDLVERLEQALREGEQRGGTAAGEGAAQNPPVEDENENENGDPWSLQPSNAQDDSVEGNVVTVEKVEKQAETSQGSLWEEEPKTDVQLNSDKTTRGNERSKTEDASAVFEEAAHLVAEESVKNLSPLDPVRPLSSKIDDICADADATEPAVDVIKISDQVFEETIELPSVEMQKTNGEVNSSSTLDMMKDEEDKPINVNAIDTAGHSLEVRDEANECEGRSDSDEPAFASPAVVSKDETPGEQSTLQPILPVEQAREVESLVPQNIPVDSSVVNAGLDRVAKEDFMDEDRGSKKLEQDDKEEKKVEPKRRFQEKARTKDDTEVKLEEKEPKRQLEREVEKREPSRARLSQEGIGKIKEEVEKARLKERVKAESWKNELRPKRDLADDKQEAVEQYEKSEVDVGDRGVSSTRTMDIDSENQSGYKRKDADGDARQLEPSKRQRRWNSGKNLGVETDPKAADIKPNPSETVEGVANVAPAIKSPSISTPPGSRPSAARTTAMASWRSTAILKNEPGFNQEAAKPSVVPPSERPPTTSLLINNFVRPFTLKALNQLLSETGTFSDFWMDQIKTHCFVTYSTVEEAEATRNALYNLQWPPAGGKLLTVEFVEPEEVKQKLRSVNESQTAIPVMTSRGPNSNNGLAPSVPVPSPSHVPPQGSIPINNLPLPHLPASLPPQREKQNPVLKKEQEPTLLTLDDLFKKTRAKPNIYYLPLTDDQVAAKLAKKKLPARTVKA